MHGVKAVRAIFLKNYGIQGKSANGSEYFWIDVARSASRPEHGGKPLQNFDNATAIQKLVHQLLERGVPPEDITALVLY